MTTPVPGTSSGRSEPHPAAAPAHDIRWSAEIDRLDHDAAYWKAVLVAECKPCKWLVYFRESHSSAFVARIDAEHCGEVTP